MAKVSVQKHEINYFDFLGEKSFLFYRFYFSAKVGQKLDVYYRRY